MAISNIAACPSPHNLRQRPRQMVDIGLGVEWPRANPHRAFGEGAEGAMNIWGAMRSEEHTSELQSRPHLVCRLLLEKKKKQQEERLNGRKKKQSQGLREQERQV